MASTTTVTVKSMKVHKLGTMMAMALMKHRETVTIPTQLSIRVLQTHGMTELTLTVLAMETSIKMEMDRMHVNLAETIAMMVTIPPMLEPQKFGMTALIKTVATTLIMTKMAMDKI